MRIYFSGIGGVAIGPLSEIARDAGHSVIGSDKLPSLLTDELTASGMTISFDQSGKFLEDEHLREAIDWFCYTSALPPDHPELVKAQSLGIKASKRDELIAKIVDDNGLKLVAIAGTHGKTTTTGMLVWTLKELGVPASYSIGTTISFGPSGKFDPNSKFFIYECDEFDRNFLHFYPFLSLLPSVDYDHNDTYPTRDDYKQAFRQFINQSESTILWQTEQQYIGSDNSGQVVLSKTPSTNLPGEHNRRNAELVFRAIQSLGMATDENIRNAIESFPGTDRRFEKLTEGLYSDYGHHPIEIEATLQMAKELSDKVALVYQPHQNTRQHEIRDQYTDKAFDDATEVFWVPTYLTRENPNLTTLSPQDLTTNIVDKSKFHFRDLDDDLWQEISRLRQDGYLVLAMGAGPIDGWVRGCLAKSKI